MHGENLGTVYFRYEAAFDENLSHLSLHMSGVLGALTTNLPMLDRLRIRKLPSEWSRIR